MSDKPEKEKISPRRYALTMERRLPKAIRRLDQLLASKDEKIALGAVKVVLDKTIADKKELSLDLQGDLKLVLVRCQQ
jgi:hypothetical protein